MDQTLEEGALKGVGVSRERWGLAQPGGQFNILAKMFPWGTGVRRKLYMVPYHSCNIYGTWRSKEVGRGFEIII